MLLERDLVGSKKMILPIQSKLCTTATLGPEKSGCLTKVSDTMKFRLVIDDSNWLLLTGGRCSRVAVKSGLTVYIFIMFKV
jgi:hypothetical protein